MHIFVVLLRREFKTASNGVQKMYKLHLKETRILRSRKRFHLEKFCQSSETSLQEHSEFFFKHFFGYISFFCIFPFDVQFGRYFRGSIMVEFDSSYIDVHEKRFDYFVTFYLQNIIVNSDGRLQSRFFRRQSTTKVVAHFMQRGCSLEQFFLPNSTPFRKHVKVATFWKLLPSAIDQHCFLVRFKKQRAFNKICSFGKKKEKTRKEVKGKGWHVFARNRWFKNSRTKCAIVLTV